ncbi:hypothetical protein [Microbacterium sp. P04]|uniref:hypothetical protein n=1 Tax=Microbacterium sp. P04 TaxID=3366947 RepID=UPI0037452CB6
MFPGPDFAPLLHPTAPPRGVNPDAFAVQSLAAANGWEYFTHTTEQPFPGVVFREPSGAPRYMQRAVNIVRIPGQPVLEIGNSAYTEIAIGNQFTQYWGYAAAAAPGMFPTVIIEADRNRQRSALPSLPRGAVATSRGAAGRAVVIHTDPAAAAWAAAIFTDELCALLDDGTVAFDLELAGGWVFLYAPQPLATADPRVWQRILDTMGAVLERLQSAPAAAPATPPASAAAAPSAWNVAAAQPAPPAAEMRSRGGAVNGGRIGWYLGAIAAAVVLFGAAFTIFGPR